METNILYLQPSYEAPWKNELPTPTIDDIY